MTATSRGAVPVLVVGAGPAGLAAAITLARSGVDVAVVDRRADPSSLPRATVVSTRSMELIRSWGLEEEVRAGGDEVEWMMWECETLARAPKGTAFPVGYPTAAQAALISPTAPACVPQDHLEAVLFRHLRSLPRASVELGVELVSVTTGPEAARVGLLDRSTGEAREIEARTVIGADGAHSGVRRASGIAMRGPEDLGAVFTVVFRAPLWDLVGPHRYGIYSITHDNVAGTFLPSGGGDRWHYGIMRPTGEEEFEELTEHRLIGMIRLAAGVPELQPRIERTGTFSFAAQIADRFRHGNVFLIGDAAHRVTPRGGTGMNAAMADGFDLGWKLGWVRHGWAGPALLDTYETDRRPIVEHQLARSIDPGGSRRDAIGELQHDLGGRIPHAWLRSGREPASTVDLIGPGLTLFIGPHGGAWEHPTAAPATGVPVAVRRLDHATALALGVRGSGALLVRPDGAPVGSWAAATDPATALRVAVRSVTFTAGEAASAA